MHNVMDKSKPNTTNVHCGPSHGTARKKKLSAAYQNKNQTRTKKHEQWEKH